MTLKDTRRSLTRCCPSNYERTRNGHESKCTRNSRKGSNKGFPSGLCLLVSASLTMSLVAACLPAALALTPREEKELLLELKSSRSWRPDGKLRSWSADTDMCSEWSGVSSCTPDGNIKALRLDGNQLAGTLPEQWSALTKLTEMVMDGNGLTGPLPYQWSTLTGLTEIVVDENELTGPLPRQWSALTRLTEMVLEHNALTGPLPEQWSTLTDLTRLTVDYNDIVLKLPQQWSALIRLQDLLLFNNKLTGPLPEQWSTLTRLETLDLTNNKLEGPLPAQWSTLTRLNEIALGSNQLSGALPEQWSTLTTKRRMYGFDGKLTGLMDFSFDGIPSEGWPAFCSSKPSAPPVTSSIPAMGEVQHKGDLLYYYHPLKSGGTSVVNTWHHEIRSQLLPGTANSDYFKPLQLANAVKRSVGPGKQHRKTVDFFLSRSWVASSHTSSYKFATWTMQSHYPDYWKLLSLPAYALPSNGSHQPAQPQRSKVPNNKQGPPFFHKMTFVRHPVYWAASRMGEALCAFQKRGMFGRKCDFNLTDYRRRYLQAERERCASNNRRKGRRHPQTHGDCIKQAEHKAEYCSDTDALLSSDTGIGHQLLDTTSEFHELCTDLIVADDNGHISGGEEAYASCYRTLVEHMRRLLLVGVTERMTESMCLLHYYIKQPLTTTMGKARFKSCRPIGIWTPTAKATAVWRNPRGWAGWDAANTVLTERMAEAGRQLRALAQEIGVGPVEAMPWIIPGCWDLKTQTAKLE